MAVMDDVLLLYEALDTCNTVKESDTADVTVRRAMMITKLTYDNNKLLKACKESLAQGVISDSFDSDFWTQHYTAQSIKGGFLEKALENYGNVAMESLDVTFGVGKREVKVVRDFRDLIESGLEEMNQLLADIQAMMGVMTSDKFAQFYFSCRDRFSDGPIRKAYLNWRIEQRELSIPILKARQNEALYEFLLSRVISHDKRLKVSEKKGLDIESFVADLPVGTEMTEELTNLYAMMNRYITWVDSLMLVDYEGYGRFVCSCFNKLSKEGLLALFKFDITLSLIHQDMVKLNPELARHLPQYMPLSKDNHHFAIVKSITVKMERFWSEKVITDRRFKLSYIEQLLNELLDSEWGKAIAQDWRIRSKRDKLECKIIGAMKDAGITSVSYNALAPKISQIEKIPDSIANYLGQGKDEPYFDWICEYVRG
jgi:hypothetical protein